MISSIVICGITVGLCIVVFSYYISLKTYRYLTNKNVIGVVFISGPITVVLSIFGLGYILYVWNILMESKLGESMVYYSISIIAIILGSSIYILIVDNTVGKVKTSESVKTRGLGFIFTLIFVIDLYARFAMIREGVYFTWTQHIFPHQTLEANTSSFYAIHDILKGMVMPVGVYAYYKYDKKNLILALLIAHILLVVGSGQRRQVLYLILYTSLTTLYVGGKKYTKFVKRHILKILVLLGLFFFVAMPVMQDARKQIQMNAHKYTDKPTQIPYDFLSRYVPRSIFRYFGGQEKGQKGKGFGNRIRSYNSVMAEIAVKRNKNYGMPAHYFMDELLMVVPEVLYPQKPFSNQASRMRDNFIGGVHSDVHSTPFSYAYAISGITGVLLLWLLFSLLSVLSYLTISLLGNLKPLVAIGSLHVFLPIGNGFANLLAGIRNLIVVSAILYIILVTYKTISS